MAAGLRPLIHISVDQEAANTQKAGSISFSVQPASDSLSVFLPHSFLDLPKHCHEGRARVFEHLSLGDEGGISHSNHRRRYEWEASEMNPSTGAGDRDGL